MFLIVEGAVAVSNAIGGEYRGVLSGIRVDVVAFLVVAEVGADAISTALGTALVIEDTALSKRSTLRVEVNFLVVTEVT